MTTDDVLRVSSDDILYRLQKEEQERAEALRRWRANAHGGDASEDDHIHTLVRDAAQEIARLRIALSESTRPKRTP
ncbi:putative protein OS=Bosea thiooxidans OX=53254 GN=SAMN05660750_01650 PE=4 SV=1 [Bosea thiooxidans]|uniref:Uncharacterized protein n=1 Tax=Bosea thiooxidans TaxID=53254 RepID=A0A1T5CUN3_9HYPH|nr:hypothetical protein [Bosea thiooxidans]SKB62900.1 hypothetical protein SAMN05660750_01650 [Bosea thiooxidans]